MCVFWNCDKCKFISITEEEQHKFKYIKEDHICNKHRKRVFHRNLHKGLCDYIEPCYECRFDDFELRINI